MKSLELLTIIFFIELAILVIGGLMISLLNIWLRLQQNKQRKIKSRVFEKVFSYLFSSEHRTDFGLVLSKEELKISILIGIIEEINQKIDDGNWKKLRAAFLDKYLRQWAYRHYKSIFWMKRNYAARILMQDPLPEEEKYILKLMNDSVLLVRIHIIIAAQKLATGNCFRKILAEFVKDKGFSSYIYRDAFLTAGQKSFIFLRTELLSNPPELVKIICLEMLSNWVFEKLEYDLNPDISSDNPELRYSALKCYVVNPDDKLSAVLIKSLSDENWKIRGFCAYKLGELKIKQAIPYLLKSIQDRVWWVRLNSAIGLKLLDQDGLYALKNIDPDIDHYAYEMSQYILAMPSEVR